MKVISSLVALAAIAISGAALAQNAQMPRRSDESAAGHD